VERRAVAEPVAMRVACSRLVSMVAMTPNNLVRVSGFGRGVFTAGHRGGRGGGDRRWVGGEATVALPRSQGGLDEEEGLEEEMDLKERRRSMSGNKRETEGRRSRSGDEKLKNLVTCFI
jgi:hypothetical protein